MKKTPFKQWTSCIRILKILISNTGRWCFERRILLGPCVGQQKTFVVFIKTHFKNTFNLEQTTRYTFWFNPIHKYPLYGCWYRNYDDDNYARDLTRIKPAIQHSVRNGNWQLIAQSGRDDHTYSLYCLSRFAEKNANNSIGWCTQTNNTFANEYVCLRRLWEHQWWNDVEIKIATI